MRPSFIPEITSTYTKKKTKAPQAWHKNGRCPKNTVPIRRIMKEDILRSKSIESFGKKTTSSIPENDPSKGHEYAVMNSMQGKYFGTKFAVNMWKPEVQVPNEFSLAQTWLVSGVGTTRNTIEAGLSRKICYINFFLTFKIATTRKRHAVQVLSHNQNNKVEQYNTERNWQREAKSLYNKRILLALMMFES
ncbi:hypothetical protein YC2023_061662 [Brassica napus]